MSNVVDDLVAFRRLMPDIGDRLNPEIETANSKAEVAQLNDHRNQIRFSLRDLSLVTVGSSALIAALSWIGRASGQGGWFYAVYSIPIIAGMTGLLLRQFWGGVVGALIGGFALWALLMSVG